MGLLEQLLAKSEETIRSTVSAADFRPGKFSVWLKFVRLNHQEETVGGCHKVLFTAQSLDELIHQVAENALLSVFGAEVPVVDELPNLILKLPTGKYTIAMPGAQPLDKPDQIYLKATVYEYHPSLWEQLFHRFKNEEPTDAE